MADHRESQLRWHAVVRPMTMVRGRWLIDVYGRTLTNQTVEHVAGPTTRTLAGARRLSRRLVRRLAAERGGWRGRILVDR